MAALFPILLTIQIVVCIAMIGVILLQRSEGGGLGLGTGGGAGGLMTGRGTANALTRTTVILGTIFITTSIALALVAKATRSTGPLTPGTDGTLTTLPGAPQPSSTPLPATPNPSPTPVPAAPPAPAAPAPAGGQPTPATPPAQPAGGTP